MSENIPLNEVELGNCGKMSQTFDNLDEKKSYEEYMEHYDSGDYDMRIVGGVDAPEPVPWYALLKIGTQNETLPGSQCGATLISSRFLTFSFSFT